MKWTWEEELKVEVGGRVVGGGGRGRDGRMKWTCEEKEELK